jgi:hypothetical protein
MQLIHVIVWQYMGGGGFDWYTKEDLADACFEVEKEIADDYKDERWIVKQTTLEVPDGLLIDEIIEFIEPLQYNLFRNAKKLYPIEAYQVKEVIEGEERVVKYDPQELIKLYDYFELATCQIVGKGADSCWERVSVATYDPKAPTLHTIYGGTSYEGAGVTALFDLASVGECRRYAGYLQEDTGLSILVDSLVERPKEECIIKYNPKDLIKRYHYIQLATCQRVAKGNWERVNSNTYDPKVPTVHTIYGRNKLMVALFDLDTVADCRKCAMQLHKDTGLNIMVDALVEPKAVVKKASKVIKNVTGVKRRE